MVNERVQEPWQWKAFMGKNTARERTQRAHYWYVAHCFLFIYSTFIRRILPHSDVKYVTAHTAGDNHIRQTSTCHDPTGDQVRHGRPCSQNRQAYNRLRDAKGFTHLHSVNQYQTEYRNRHKFYIVS